MPEHETSEVLTWFRESVRPILVKTEPKEVVDELDKLAAQLERMEENREQHFPVCLLGQAGVGKSTLINTLIADNEIVVPSGGGMGPLTANALRVVYGDQAAFAVRYHEAKVLNRTRFIIEAAIFREKGGEVKAPKRPVVEPEDDVDLEEIDLDDEVQNKTRLEEALGRARLMVGGAQSAQRDLFYLADAFRWVLGQKNQHGTQILPEDQERLEQIKEALGQDRKGQSRTCTSADNPEFNRVLRDHACGFLAPMILEMTINWPSLVLTDGLEIVDLPGIGILSDAYAAVTSDYLRNRAKAVMLVADSRGIRKEDAELLRSSGFLNRMLHASSDLSADPVAFFVTVVKIDDVAVENWRNDKAVNGKALKSKAEHFHEQVEQCRSEIKQRLGEFLREVWEDDSQGKREVIDSILEALQVFPVSAPQYRLHVEQDEDEERPFLPGVEETNIPALRDAIADVASRCLAEQRRRLQEMRDRFFGQLRAKLELLDAQLNEESRVEGEVEEFRAKLVAYLAPLRREFDTRRGGFRAFLRKTIPAKIEAKVELGSSQAQKSIRKYLNKLRDAHWKTLQASVRREGTFYGRLHINLPKDFSLTFEEPIAEVWSRELLVEIRKETKEFADYQADVINQVLDWARQNGTRVSLRLLEALVGEVKERRQQLNAVGREAVEELRDKVREQLIKTIEGPIRRKCKKFVNDQKDAGSGVKIRILNLFDQLAEDVVAAAAEPAATLLTERFKEVEGEILKAFRDHSDPLEEAAEVLLQKKEKDAWRIDGNLKKAVSEACQKMPQVELVELPA